MNWEGLGVAAEEVSAGVSGAAAAGVAENAGVWEPWVSWAALIVILEMC